MNLPQGRTKTFRGEFPARSLRTFHRKFIQKVGSESRPLTIRRRWPVSLMPCHVVATGLTASIIGEARPPLPSKPQFPPDLHVRHGPCDSIGKILGNVQKCSARTAGSLRIVIEPHSRT